MEGLRKKHPQVSQVGSRKRKETKRGEKNRVRAEEWRVCGEMLERGSESFYCH